MRWHSIAVLLMLALTGSSFWRAAVADELEDDYFDEEDETDDEFQAAGGGGGGEPSQPEPVEDFDLSMPDTDRKRRMKACVMLSSIRAQLRSAELASAVEDIMSRMSVQKTQAENYVMFPWMMSCYMNVDEPMVQKTVRQDRDLSEMSSELEAEIFNPREDRPQQVRQASKRQWTLLQEVLQDYAQSVQGEQSSGRPRRAESDFISDAGTAGGATTALIFFAVLFGLVGLVVLRLARAEKEGASKGAAGSSRKERKAEKAGKKNR
mmetsp:Transcript_55264/g.131764  ORF Transcript_55264/g.131764 Transcript_55264/m.131764 type:complete len:265 (-) Transcript_55264:130-924(-)